MTRHPLILEQLGTLLPPGGRREDTRLAEDLRLGDEGRADLHGAIQEAWDISLDTRAVARWRTLGDVADTIADAMPVAA